MKPFDCLHLPLRSLRGGLCACLVLLFVVSVPFAGEPSGKAGWLSHPKVRNLRDVASQVRDFAKPHRGQGAAYKAFSIPLETTPFWSSTSFPSASVWGTHFVDLTKDGYPEVVMVGEQMPCYVFANRLGVVDTAPSWQSNDADLSIWASFGDYNHDGYLDMAVANYSFGGGQVKVYRNESGVLNPDAAWTGSGGGACCEWGDVNNDGYPDLATADLFAYPAVYLNRGGTLEATPSWTGVDYNIDFGCAWVDVDNDGRLDLAVTGINPGEPVLRVYHNRQGTLETTASWTSTLDPNTYTGAMLSVGDIDRDGWQDVTAPLGLFYTSNPNAVFKNQSGVLERMPSWFSSDALASTSGALGDLNGDGYLDWAVNSDASPAVAYENSGGTLNPTPSWQSSTSGGIGVELGDVDQDGVRYREDTLLADGTKRLFYLSVLPVHRLEGILLNGNPLPLDAYCYSLKSGWVSLRDSVSAGSRIIVRYRHSVDMELLQSDYGNSRAYLFRNTSVGVEQGGGERSSAQRYEVIAPNPFVSFAAVRGREHETFLLYDITGRKVGPYRGDRIGEGLSPGVYFLKSEDKAGKPVRVVKVR